MRSALVIEWSGHGKATLTGVNDPFILIDAGLLALLGIEKAGTHHLPEARIRMQEAGEPWQGELEWHGERYALVAEPTSSFLDRETYTLCLDSSANGRA